MILKEQRTTTYLHWQIFYSRYIRCHWNKKANFIGKGILVTAMTLSMAAFAPAGAATNTGIDGQNDSISFAEIGFGFQYYGNPYYYFAANRNGYMQLQQGFRAVKADGTAEVNEVTDGQEGGEDLPINACLPVEGWDKNNGMFVFWDALQTHIDQKPAGSVLYEVQGESPNQKLIVQWTDMYFADTGLPMGTFQAILYEQTNQIKFQYLDLQSERARGGTASIGIQGQENWWSEEPEIPFVQIGCNEGNQIRAGQAITFTPFIKEMEEWDYVVDENAVFEDMELFDLTPFAPGATSQDYQTYTNQAPEWTWKASAQLDTYEIEVWEGNSWDRTLVYTQTLGNLNHFSYSAGLVHGKQYTARVRARLGNDEWTSWSDFSRTTYVDTQNPTAEIKTFLRTDEAIWLNLTASDSNSGIASTKIEIATDEDFENIIYETVKEGYPSSVTINSLPQSGNLYVRSDAIDGAGNHSGYTPVYAIIDRPMFYTAPRYSQGSLSWSWVNESRYVLFEYEMYTEEGELVRKGSQNPMYTSVVANYAVHGKTVRARIRGQVLDGSRWGAWSEWSSPTTIDLVAPTVALGAFTRTGDQSAAVDYSSVDDLSGVRQITLQISTDSSFNTIDRTIYLSVDGTHFEIDNISQNVSLYARIKAIDYAGNESEYSDVQAIADVPTITVEKPYTTQAPQWHWNKLPGFNAYEIEISNWPNTANVIYSEVLGDIDSFTYTEAEHGKYYVARVRASTDGGNSWGAWSYTSSLVMMDTVNPTVELNAFFFKGDGSAQINYAARDDGSGVERTHLQIASDAQFVNLLVDQDVSSQNTVYMVSGLPQQSSLYARMNAVDRAGNESGYTPVLQIGLEVPSIQSPVNASTLHTSVVAVSGKAQANGEVQLYLNGEAVGERIAVNAAGQFSGHITLPAEGAYSIKADVRNSFGTSSPSSNVNVTYALPVPSVSFVTPSHGSTIAAPLQLEVSAMDVLGIEKVEFYDGDALLGEVSTAPYQYQWNVTYDDNGSHDLKAAIINTSGKSVTIERSVTVDVAPQKPVVPPTPYTGQVNSISPAISYGSEPIRITGTAVDRNTAGLMTNKPLKLVLSVGGFKRTINIVTDAAGAFSYDFVPQTSDKGTYQVSVIHPDEVDAVQGTSQGSFNINRVSFDIGGYKLTTARNYPSEFTVKATSSGAVQGLKWVMVAEDQPSGSLPQGVVIHSNGMDVAEGKSASMAIRVTVDDTALETGTVILRAVSEDAADSVRGTLRLDYKLVPAQPMLFIQKNSIQTGVQQGDSVSETITFSNKGISAARNVRVELLDEQGNAPPAWMFLANTGILGTVNVGSELAVQVTAQPDESIVEGIYRFKLNITADNAPVAQAYITVAITQSGIGGVRFDVADIYTATLGEDGQPIPGVKGVTIKLQNEAVLSEQYQVTTGVDGTALLEELPPGIYIFRASASNHMDVSGRVRIRPGVTTNQHIFLDYQLINIEFGVTETTINDVYDIVLEATYQTQVPAPVVLLEPLSINIGEMQVGEEKVGQLTLTNYGLVQAENVEVGLPQSDETFKFEFFGEIPSVLSPKTRIVIPYRVSALSAQEAREQGAEEEIQSFALMVRAAPSCASYVKPMSVKYDYICANDDVSVGKASSHFYRLTGSSCSSNSIQWGSGTGWGYAGGSGGPSYGTPEAIPMAEQCIPGCPDGKCAQGSTAGQGGRK